MKILLSDTQRLKILAFLKNEPCVYAGNNSGIRLFVEAVLRILRSGAQRRLLPPEYGRHPVECFINKIKHFRHIFSRFDKPAERYLSFLHFAGTPVWLRLNVNRT